MKRDYTTISIIVGVLVLLASIFLDEYLFGLNIPLIILALGFMVFAHFRQKKSVKNGLKKRENINEED